MWGNMGAIWGASEGKILVARKPPGAMWAMGSYDCYIPDLPTGLRKLYFGLKIISLQENNIDYGQHFHKFPKER